MSSKLPENVLDSYTLNRIKGAASCTSDLQFILEQESTTIGSSATETASLWMAPLTSIRTLALASELFITIARTHTFLTHVLHYPFSYQHSRDTQLIFQTLINSLTRWIASSLPSLLADLRSPRIHTWIRSIRKTIQSTLSTAFHVILATVTKRSSFSVISSISCLLLTLFIDDHHFSPFFLHAGQTLVSTLAAFVSPYTTKLYLSSEVDTNLLPASVSAVVYNRELTRKYHRINAALLPLLILQNRLGCTFTIKNLRTKEGYKLGTLSELHLYCSDTIKQLIEHSNSTLNDMLNVTAFMDVSHFASFVFVQSTHHTSIKVAPLIPHSLPLVLQTCKHLLVTTSPKNDHTLSQILHLRLLRTSLVSFLGHTQSTIASLNPAEKDFLWPQIKEIYRYFDEGLTKYSWSNPNLSRFVESCVNSAKKFDQTYSFLQHAKKLYISELSQKTALVAWEKPCEQISITAFANHTKETLAARRSKMMLIDSKMAQIRAQTKLQSNRVNSLDDVFDTIDKEFATSFASSQEQALHALADDISSGSILFEIPVSLQTKLSPDGTRQTSILLLFPETDLGKSQEPASTSSQEQIHLQQETTAGQASPITTFPSFMDALVQLYSPSGVLHSSDIAFSAYDTITNVVRATEMKIDAFKAQFSKFTKLWTTNPISSLASLLEKGHDGNEPVFPQIPHEFQHLSDVLQQIVARQVVSLQTSLLAISANTPDDDTSTQSHSLPSLFPDKSDISTPKMSPPLLTSSDPSTPVRPSTESDETEKRVKPLYPAPNASAKEFKQIVSLLVELMSEISQSSFEERHGCVVLRMDSLKRDLIEIVMSWLNPFGDTFNKQLLTSLRHGMDVLRSIKHGFNTNLADISFEEKLQVVHHFNKCGECFEEMAEFQREMNDRLEFAVRSISVKSDALRQELSRFGELWETMRQNEWRLYSHQMQQLEDTVLTELHSIHAAHQTAVHNFLDQLQTGPGVPRRLSAGTLLAKSQLVHLNTRLAQLEKEQERVETLWRLFNPDKAITASVFSTARDILNRLSELWGIIGRAEVHFEQGVLNETWSVFVSNSENRTDPSILSDLDTITLPVSFNVLPSFRAIVKEHTDFVAFFARLATHPLSSLDWDSIVSILLKFTPNQHHIDTTSLAQRLVDGNVLLADLRRLFSTSALDKLRLKEESLERRDKVWEQVKEMLEYYNTFSLPTPRSVFVLTPNHDPDTPKQFTIQIKTVDRAELDRLRNSTHSPHFPRFDIRVLNWLLFVGKRDADLLCTLLRTENTSMMRKELDVLMFVVDNVVSLCTQIHRICSLFDEAAVLDESGMDRLVGIDLADMKQAMHDTTHSLNSLKCFASQSISGVVASLRSFNERLVSSKLKRPASSPKLALRPSPSNSNSPASMPNSSKIHNSILVQIFAKPRRLISGIAASRVNSSLTRLNFTGTTSALILESVETTHNDRLVLSRTSLPFPPSSNCLSFPLALQRAIEDELHGLTVAQMNTLHSTSFVAWLMTALHRSIFLRTDRMMQIIPLVIEEWFSSSVSRLADGLSSDDVHSALLGFVRLLDDLNTSITFLMTLQRCNELTLHNGSPFNSVVSVMEERRIQTGQTKTESRTRPQVTLDSDFFWLTPADSIDEESEAETTKEARNAMVVVSLTRQRETEKKAHHLIALFIRVLLQVRQRALVIQAYLTHAQVLQLESPETVLPSISAEEMEMIANDLPVRAISIGIISDLSHSLRRTLHVTFDADTLSFSHPFPEADVSLDQLDPWANIPHRFDLLPGLSSFPTQPTTSQTTWMRSAVRMAFVDAISGTFSVGGVCMLCSDETYGDVSSLLSDFAASLGAHLKIVPCSMLTWHTSIQRVLFDAVCEGSFVLLDRIDTLSPSTLTLLSEWMTTIQEFRKTASLSKDHTILFELDRLRAELSLPLKPSFISTTFMTDSDTHHTPSAISATLRCLSIEPLPAAALLTPLLLEQGFCYAESLAKTFSEFTDAMLAVIMTRLSDFTPQTKKHLSSTEYLNWVARTAGEFLRTYLFELRNEYFPSEHHARVDLIAHFDLLLHSPSCLCAPHLFTNSSLFDEQSEQVHRSVEMDAMKATVNHFLHEVWLPLAVQSHNDNLYEKKDEMNRLPLPRIDGILNRLVDSFFPSPVMVDPKESSSDQSPGYILPRPVVPDQILNELAPVAVHMLEVHRKVSGLSTDHTQLLNIIKMYRTVENDVFSVIQGQSGSGKNTVLSLVKVLFETQHSVNIRLININHTDIIAHLNSTRPVAVIHKHLLNKLQSVFDSDRTEKTGKDILESLPLHSDPNSVLAMLEQSPEPVEDDDPPPIWLVFRIRTATLPKNTPVTYDSWFGCHFRTNGNSLHLITPDEQDFLLPRHSRLILQMEASITRIPLQITVSHRTISVAQPSASVAFWLYESWARRMHGKVDPDELYATVATLRSMTPTLFAFLHFKDGTVVHSKHGRLNIIGCVRTVTTLMESLIVLHMANIRTPIDSQIMTLFLSFSVTWGFLGHLCDAGRVKIGFMEWLEGWVKEHEQYENEEYFNMKQALSKDASEFEGNSRPVTESFNCTALIHQLFPDARFFKSGSVFDFVPDTVSKEFVHLADLEASHSIFGPAHTPTTSFGILNNFMPFIQLVFPVLLLAFSGRPTIILDDSSIKGRSYTKVFSAAIAHTLSNIHVADTASIYVCPHSKHYGLNIHLTPDKFNHTVTAQLQRLCHNFTDSVFVSRCPYAPLLVHVTAQPNETKDGHPTLPEKKGETTPNGAISSFVHFAKTKVLETIDGGRKMIGRNPTVLTMTDAVLFTSSADPNYTAYCGVLACQPPSCTDLATLFVNLWKQSSALATCDVSSPDSLGLPSSSGRPGIVQNFVFETVIPAILHISEQIKQREEVLVHPTTNALLNGLQSFCHANQTITTTPENLNQLLRWELERVFCSPQQSPSQVAIVKKIITHSLSIFNQSTQDYNRSPTTPHEAESKTDKADTLFEMIMVQSGVEVRIYPHSRGSIPPPLVHVVPGQAGKFSPMLASCGVLALSSDFLKQLLHLSETILTVSEPLIVFSQSSHTTNMMLKAVSSVNGLVTRQTQVPHTPRTVKPFLDILADFVVECGHGSLLQDITFLAQMQDRSSLELKINTSYTYESPIVLTPQQSYFCPQPPILLEDVNLVPSREGIFELEFMHAKTEYQQFVFLLQYVLRDGQAPTPLRPKYEALTGEEKDVFAVDSFEDVCLYLFRRMAWGLERKGKTECTNQTIQALLWHAAEHTEIVIKTHTAFTIDVVAFLGPLAAFSSWFTVPELTKEIRDTVATAILEPVFATLPNMWTKLTQSDETLHHDEDNAFANSSSIFRQRVIETTSELFALVVEFAKKQGNCRTLFGCSQSDPNLGLEYTPEPSAADFVDFVQYFAQFVKLFCKYEEIHTKELTSALASIYSFPTKAKLLQGYLSHVQLNGRLHDPHEIVKSRLAEISTEMLSLNQALAELQSVEQSFPLSTQPTGELATLQEILGRAYSSLINITTSSLEDLRDVHMSSPPLQDLYNLLLLMVPLDSSKPPTTYHAAHILQAMWEFDVSLQPLQKMSSIRLKLHAITPQSQLPLYPAVILHVWNWIDDTTLFRIESESQTSVSRSKLMNIVKGCAISNRQFKIRTILEGLTTEQKSLTIFLTEPNLAERMEEIVEVLIEEMRLVENLSQMIKELNESVTSELLTMTVLKKEIVTSALSVAATMCLLHRFIPKQNYFFVKTLVDPLLEEKRLIMGKTADVMNVLFRFNHHVFTDSSLMSLSSSPRDRGSFGSANRLNLSLWQSLPAVLELHSLETVCCSTQQLTPELLPIVNFAPNRNGDTCLSGRHYNFNGQLDRIHTAKHHLNEEDRPDFLVFSGPHELANRVFLKILFASGFFYLTYCIFPLSNSHFTDVLSPNTHIPFTARVRVPLIFDRLSVFTGFQRTPSRDMPNLYSIYGITNPQLSPNVISLKNVNCLQNIHEMLKTIADQASPPPPTPFSARSTIGMPKMLRKRDSKAHLSAVKKTSELRTAVILVDVGENTMTREVEEIVMQYSACKSQRLSTIFISRANIGNEVLTNSMFQLTLPSPTPEKGTQSATVTYSLPLSFDLILVAPKDENERLSGLWVEHTYAIPIVPNEAIFKNALYSPTHRAVSVTASSLGPKDAQGDVPTLTRRMASVRETQKTVSAFFSSCLRHINHFVNDQSFPFMSIPHSTQHDPLRLSLLPTHHFHPLTNPASLSITRSQSDLDLTEKKSEDPQVLRGEHLHSSGQNDDYLSQSMGRWVVVPQSPRLSSRERSHSLSFLDSVMSPGSAHPESPLTRHSVHSLSASHSPTISLANSALSAQSDFGFSNGAEFNLEPSVILDELVVNEVLPSNSIYSVLLSLSTRNVPNLQMDATLQQLRTWLMGLDHAEQEWRNAVRHLLNTYDWEEKNIWPFVEISAIFSFGYLRIHSMPFGQNSPALWNRQTFETVLSVASAIIEDADGTARIVTSTHDSFIKAPTPKPADLILSHQQSPAGKDDTRKGIRMVPTLPKRVVTMMIEQLAHSFLTLFHQTSSSLSDYTSLVFHILLQLQKGEKTELSALEKSILLSPLTVCLHSLEDATFAAKQARSPTPVAHRVVLFAEIVQLQLPLQSGIFQAAGLMPVNPAAEWLPNHAWKNAFTLAAICPSFRPFVLDLHSGVSSLFAIIDHIPVTNPKEEEVVHSLLFPIASAGISQTLHATITTSFDREAANLIADSLFDVSAPVGLTQTEQKRQKQVLLDRIVKGMRVKTKQEQTRVRTDFHSEKSFHAFEMEELIEHDDSAFDGSPPHRSSLPHVFTVWREWFSHDFNYILPIPNIEMDGLTTLQRILFFDALLLKTTDKLVTTAINEAPLLGHYAALFELSSLSLAHPANDRIYRTRSFPFVFVHSESLQTLLQNSYNMHDRVYTPGKQFFRVVLLFFQRQPFSSFIPMDDVAATLTAYTSKINHRVTTVKCGQFARRVMTEEFETDQRMGQMESAELWARAWQFAETTLTELWEEQGWIIVEGLEKTSVGFVRAFSMWAESHFLDASDIEGESTSVLWVFIPDGTNDAETRTLDALSPRLCQSTRMTIRQATTFRTMMLSYLTSIPSIAQKETRMKVVRHYDPHAHRAAQTYRSVFFLLTAATALHASITLYLDTVMKQKKDVEMVSDTRSIRTILNLLIQPGVVDNQPRSDTASRRPDGWNLWRLKEAILKRAYGYMHGSISSKQLMAVANHIISHDSLFSEHAVPLVPGLAPPSSNQFVTSIAAVLKQIMSSAMSEREMTQFFVRPTTEMDGIRDHLDQNRAQIMFRSVLQLDLTFLPFLKSESSLVYDLTTNPKNTVLSASHALSNQRAFAVGCNDRTDFTFNMNATYHPFVLARLWKESALIIQRDFPNITAVSNALISTYLTEAAIPLHMVVLVFDLAFTITQIESIRKFGAVLPLYLTSDKNDPTDSDVTISKSLLFDSISLTAQNAFLPQMMHFLSRFSADSLLVWTSLGQGRVPVSWACPSTSGLRHASSPLNPTNQPRVLQWLNQVVSMWKQAHSFTNAFEMIRTANMIEDAHSKHPSDRHNTQILLHISLGLMANPDGFVVGCLTDITQSLRHMDIEKKRSALQHEDHEARHLLNITRRQNTAPFVPPSQLPSLTQTSSFVALQKYSHLPTILSEFHQVVTPLSQRDLTIHLYPAHLSSLPHSIVSPDNPASNVFSLRFIGLSVDSVSSLTFLPSQHTLAPLTKSRLNTALSSLVLPNPRHGLVCATEPTSAALLLPSVTQRGVNGMGTIPLAPCVVIDGVKKIRNIGLNVKHRLLTTPLLFHALSTPINKMFVVFDDERHIDESDTSHPNIAPSIRFLDSTMSPLLSSLAQP